MTFDDLPLAGAKLIRGVPSVDDRGSFERVFSEKAFAAEGLDTAYPEVSLSYNAVAGTRRGLHFQRAPYEEAKIIRCVRGAIYDVIVDLREGSSTFGQNTAVTVSADDPLGIYVPCGFAHGFQTLTDDTTVAYFISEPYRAECAAGIASDDPELAIRWPAPAVRMSERDRGLPRLSEVVL